MQFRSNMYSIAVGDEEMKRAKRVKKNVVKKHEHYKTAN